MKRITKKIALLLSAVCIFIMVQVPGMEVQANDSNNILTPTVEWKVVEGETISYELTVKSTFKGKFSIYGYDKNVVKCEQCDYQNESGAYTTYKIAITGLKAGTTTVQIQKGTSSNDNNGPVIGIPVTVTAKTSEGKDDSSGNTDTSGQQSSQGQGSSDQQSSKDQDPSDKQSSTDKDGSSSTPSEDTNVPTPITPEETNASTSTTSAHTHNYTWVTVQEATKLQDGLEEYKCDCGMVEERSVIPSSQVYVKELYGKLKDAAENGTVTFDSGKLYTISDYIIKKLQDRNDVTTVIDFEYNQAKYRMTIPAGVDYTKLLEDQDYFYGYFFFANEVGATIENGCEDL